MGKCAGMAGRAENGCAEGFAAHTCCVIAKATGDAAGKGMRQVSGQEMGIEAGGRINADSGMENRRTEKRAGHA